MSCPQREKLTVDYVDAIKIFSATVSRLRECQGNGQPEFAEQHKATELARLHVSNIRVTLDMHRAEHGC